MMLEELLRIAAANGMTHLTLYPVPSADGKTIFWAARAAPSTGHGYVHTENLDPVKALTGVLGDLPKAKKRVTAAVKPRFDEVNPPLSEMPQRAAKKKAPEPTTFEDFLPKP